MAEQPQPRRYVTRASTRANTTTASSSSLLPTLPVPAKATRRVSVKRKALGEATNDSPTTSDTSAKPKGTRAAKKPLTSAAAKSAGLNAAPVRRSARGTAALANEPSAPAPVRARSTSKLTTTMRSSKKVSFASPIADDKENSPPKATSNDDFTDIVMSASLGALSVKPKRTRQSKIKPPTGSLMGPIPELSPLKARRLPRTNKVDDNGLDDIFNAPVSPGLSARPMRVVPFALSAKKNPMDGADLLQKDPFKSSTLYGSPARRPPTSPRKAPVQESTNSPVKPSGLSSPAKRPIGGSRLASTTKSARPQSSLKFCITMENEDDPFRDSDASEDELSVAFKPVDRKLFTKTPSSVPKKSQPSAGSSGGFFTDFLNSDIGVGSEMLPHTAELDSETMDRKIGGMPASFPTTPPSPVDGGAPASPVSPTPLRQGPSGSLLDLDGDVLMDADENNDVAAENFAPVAVQKTKHHRCPSEGGSSYGFFGFEMDDEDGDDIVMENDENAAPKGIAEIADQRKPMTRGFGQELDDHSDIIVGEPTNLFGDINLDPALGSEEVVVGYSEISSSTTVPVKLNSIDDVEEVQPQQNTATSSRSPIENLSNSSRRKRRSSGLVSPGGVLAGAVVYCDVHTIDGMDASEGFIEMLNELGATVRKQWNWKPNSSDKIGITHVVFKEGSPRTLQKVKSTKGIVKCVGLSWIIGCTESKRWIEEDAHLVDLDVIPRGGGRRRKSMEPKALEKQPGNSSTPVPSTPSKPVSTFKAPRTEPPKMMMLTPSMRLKVLEARRKSMQFAPKVGSPLRRGMTMDD